MKKLIILITLFSLTACINDGPEKNYDYTIINNSGAAVEIISYSI